jgi:hypothetical protein
MFCAIDRHVSLVGSAVDAYDEEDIRELGG